MTGRFDEKGDLWIEVELTSLPRDVVSSGFVISHNEPLWGVAGGRSRAVTEINLTKYMRKIAQVEERSE
jgi:hypothetical protein